MKKILSLALISVFLFSISSYALVSEKQIQKDAKAYAKKLTKDGYQPAPGALPLLRQVEQCFAKQYELDDEGFPKYYQGEANTPSPSYDAAKMQALALARVNLATSIGSELAGLFTNNVANKQLGQGQAEQITQTISKSKELIGAKLSNTACLLECFRKTSEGNYEVMVRVFYSKERALKQARAAIRAELEKQSAELAETFDKAMEE